MAETRTPMKHKGRLRGDVVTVLNRLVQEGIIRGYMTNLSGKQAELALTVTRASSGSSDEELRSTIRRALAHLVPEAAVMVAPDSASA